jgi:tRNA U34 5-methylaminomethyl-2-thiouridine-forming methyltransferase MnmC
MAGRIRSDDGSWTLESARYGESYRSRRGAVLEARHVFVEGAGVAARLEGGHATRVLEIGLGTGLNLALTATLALRHGTPLSYVAVEHDPLPAHVIASLAFEHVADPAFVAAFLAWRTDWDASVGDAPPVLRHGVVRLRVIHADAVTAPLPEGVDAVYLDGFSPRVNPELWTPSALERFALTLRPGGVLTSYSVSGQVRRGLMASGLLVEKRPGPAGGKRETLRARRPDGEAERAAGEPCTPGPTGA